MAGVQQVGGGREGVGSGRGACRAMLRCGQVVAASIAL